MIAYEFHLHDPVKGSELAGILLEKRKNPERITQESIMRWGNKFVSIDFNAKDIYFIQVTIEDTGNTFRSPPFFMTQQKVKK